MSEIIKIVGERLRSYRVQCGLSQELLAEKSGLHPTYIGQLERGEKNATIESLAKVCKPLNLSLEKLFENVLPYENVPSVATECYNLIQAHPINQQKQLMEILKNITDYKQM